MPIYECDKCGACCQGIPFVETDDLDVLREPQLIDADPHHRGKAVAQIVEEIRTQGKAVIIALGLPCMFLGVDNQCTIYPTRPNCCVGLEAGDEQCQEARLRAGLEPLEPTT